MVTTVRTPFTYRLSWIKLNTHYYGCRVGRNCNPTDLWTTYFTSSKYVEEFRNKHGEPDKVKVTRVFSTPIAALTWEQKVLNRCNASKNPKLLNKCNNPYGPYMNFEGNFVDRETVLKGVRAIIEKYGGIGSGSKEIKDKVYETNKIKYGIHHTLHLDQVTRAREQGSLDKYGTINPFYSKEFQESKPQPMYDPEIKARWEEKMKAIDWSARGETSKETIKRKYGVDYITQTAEFKEKTKQTMKRRHGVEFYAQSEEFKDRIQKMKEPCPFLCRGGHPYDPGNLSKHLKVNHSWTTQQILEYRKNGTISVNFGFGPKD